MKFWSNIYLRQSITMTGCCTKHTLHVLRAPTSHSFLSVPTPRGAPRLCFLSCAFFLLGRARAHSLNCFRHPARCFLTMKLLAVALLLCVCVAWVATCNGADMFGHVCVDLGESCMVGDFGGRTTIDHPFPPGGLRTSSSLLVPRCTAQNPLQLR